MPTAVLDINMEQLPATLEVDSRYNAAFILLRYKNVPVGTIKVPVDSGYVNLHDHESQIMNAATPVLQQLWIKDHLGIPDTVFPVAPPSATVAVCTRNRTDDLKRCLDALMRMPNDGQEIIVVDNAPSDHSTRDLVASYSRVRYVLEPRPGLDVARNRALREASNRVVAFTDDDAVPDKGWLRALLRNFDHPLVMASTGLTLPLELETEGQEAFENYAPFSKGLKRKVHSSIHANPLSTGQVGAGANMAIRKDVLDWVGEFDEALDAGTATQSGGDHEFFARILIRGYKIVYDPAALSWHRHRRTMKETEHAIYGYGVGVYAYWTRLFLREGERGIWKFPWFWFRYTQLPNLYRSIMGKKNSKPLRLLLAEFKGCWYGPWAYRKASQKLNHNKPGSK